MPSIILDGKTIVIVDHCNDKTSASIFSALQQSLVGTNCNVVIVSRSELGTFDNKDENIIIDSSNMNSLHDFAEDHGLFNLMMRESKNERMFRTGEFILNVYAHQEHEQNVKCKALLPDRDANDRFGSKKKGGRRNYGQVKRIGRQGSRR